MVEPKSELLLPDTALAGGIVLGVLRDTRGAELSAHQRFNHFFTSPYCSVTWIFSGQCHVLSNQADVQNPAATSPLDQISFSGPNNRPMVSWNPGDFEALTIGFYADAWQALTGMDVARFVNRTLPLSEVIAGELLSIARSILPEAPMRSRFEQFQSALAPLWVQKRPQNHIVPARIADWVASVAVRAALGKPGKSLRQLQRRLKMLTGQSHRDLMAHARAEDLFEHYLEYRKRKGADLSQVALEAAYADQSHMGRKVARITGTSPARIDKLIASDERYWCYRLLENYYSLA